MNKSDLMSEIAKRAELSKADAGRALDAMLESISEALAEEEQVNLVGFGTFYVGERQARQGRNPKTGEAIEIQAAKMARFRAGKGLKDAVNGKHKPEEGV